MTLKTYLLLGLYLFFQSPAFCQGWQKAGDGLIVNTTNTVFFSVRVLRADSTRNMIYAGGNIIDKNGNIIHLYGLIQNEWIPLSSPSTDGNPVRYLGSYGSKILFDGTLTGVVVWEDGQLDTLPDTGFNWSVEKDSLLYVAGGSIETVQQSPGVAVWDGETWEGIGNGVSGVPGNLPSVNTITFYKDWIIAGGNTLLDSMGQELDLKYFDQGEWKAIPGWENGGATNINASIVYKGELYIAGYFNESRGALGNCIVRWDGKHWNTLGRGIEEGDIRALEVYKGELYAAGTFHEVDGIPARFIAKWDGEKWCSISGNIFDGNRFIVSLATLHDTLYAAGPFVSLNGGDTTGNVIQWVGETGSIECGNIHTAIDRKEVHPSFSVFPNPFEEEITLQINDLKPYSIEIFNVQGQTIFQSSMIRQKILDLYSLSSGIYLLKIRQEEQVAVKKIIKH